MEGERLEGLLGRGVRLLLLKERFVVVIIVITSILELQLQLELLERQGNGLLRLRGFGIPARGEEFYGRDEDARYLKSFSRYGMEEKPVD